MDEEEELPDITQPAERGVSVHWGGTTIVAMEQEGLQGDFTVGGLVERDGTPIGRVVSPPEEGVVQIYLVDNPPPPTEVDFRSEDGLWVGATAPTSWSDGLVSAIDERDQKIETLSEELGSLKDTVRALTAALLSEKNPRRLIRSPHLWTALHQGKDVSLRLLPSGDIDVSIPSDPEDPTPTVWDHLDEEA